MSVSIVLHRWTKHLVVCGIVIAAFAGLRVLADEPLAALRCRLIVGSCSASRISPSRM